MAKEAKPKCTAFVDFIEEEIETSSDPTTNLGHNIEISPEISSDNPRPSIGHRRSRSNSVSSVRSEIVIPVNTIVTTQSRFGGSVKMSVKVNELLSDAGLSVGGAFSPRRATVVSLVRSQVFMFSHISKYIIFH